MKLFAYHVCMLYPHLSVEETIKQYESLINADFTSLPNQVHLTNGTQVEYLNTYLGVAILQQSRRGGLQRLLLLHPEPNLAGVPV